MCIYIYITIWQNEKNHQRDNIQLLACLSKRMHHPGPRAKAAHDAMKVERLLALTFLMVDFALSTRGCHVPALTSSLLKVEGMS